MVTPNDAVDRPPKRGGELKRAAFQPVRVQQLVRHLCCNFLRNHAQSFGRLSLFAQLPERKTLFVEFCPKGGSPCSHASVPEYLFM